jgi:hypothetical protein
MNPYLTFQVDRRKEEVIDGMKLRGFCDKWTSNGVEYGLPECCLWRNDSKRSPELLLRSNSSKQIEAIDYLNSAMLELKEVVWKINAETASKENQITLMRCIVVTASPVWAGLR